jgi:RimJ/RimL family protein N-acetyltransferase
MKGKAIILTPIGGDRDYELLSEWSSSTSWLHATGSRHYLTPEEARKLVLNPDVKWLMVRTHDKRAIGAVNWQALAYSQSFMIGSAIGDEALWGAGYGLESILLLAQFLFHSQNAHKIQFTIGTFNKSMIELFCRGPVHIEGILRDHYFLDNAYHDAIVGSILRSEYYALLDALEIPIHDAVLSSEKAEARKIIEEHIARNPIMLRDAKEQ